MVHEQVQEKSCSEILKELKPEADVSKNFNLTVSRNVKCRVLHDWNNEWQSDWFNLTDSQNNRVGAAKTLLQKKLTGYV